LGLKFVDLYLIHEPWSGSGNVWGEFESIQKDGLAKSIGVSNFTLSQLKHLVQTATVWPAVNQIQLHPYNYAEHKALLEWATQHGIVIEAYGGLSSITKFPGGPVDAPVRPIAARLGVSMDQVLLAWTKAKGAVVLTTSSKKERLLGYLNAGDLELTTEDILSIDVAGAKGPPYARRFVHQLMRVGGGRRLLAAGLLGTAVMGLMLSGHLRFCS